MIDAAGCQREIAKQIIDCKGDFLLALKANPGKLRDAESACITKHMENDFADVQARSFTATHKGHGRLKEITF